MGIETSTTLFTPVFPAPGGVLGEQCQVRIYFIYFLKMLEAGLLPNLPLE